ncbi:GIY-YIG nuclease family protein [Chryseobacterium sp. POL2]|uniref:GIY-YIG nuclease family protein n=1 Tax=Chryseobacterium sp. POL2 TaxID=2713414 RepID=UPI0013E147A5|nr:GIY-YIG nuclease family protein [Chryseobacterium sp. POL2]QIG89194.1 GIY-YIG nuclease family protein [Chryseobacterium sp. POL2]
MKPGYMYILLCADKTYYTGSTIDLEQRFTQHQEGLGANYTSKRLPVKLVYYETFTNIADAFLREKQIQGWSHKKKTALINACDVDLKKLAECNNDSHFRNKKGG